MHHPEFLNQTEVLSRSEQKEAIEEIKKKKIGIGPRKYNHPTDRFTISKPQNPPIGICVHHKIRRSPDSEALEMVKESVGKVCLLCGHVLDIQACTTDGAR